MKIEELQKEIEKKTNEVRDLTTKKDVQAAKVSMEELRNLKDTLKIEKELQETEIRDLQNQKEIENRKEDGNMEKVNEMRAITKSLMGRELNTEERAIITSTSVGTIIPKEFLKKLEEVRQGFAPLKNLCDVIPVSKAEGSKPVIDLEQNEMKDLVEGDDIVEGSLITTDIKYKVSTIGLLEPFSHESVDDAEFELEELATKNFGEISVRKENKRILHTVNTSATASTSKKALLHQKLVDEMAGVVPAAQAGLITLVNTAAYQELKNKEDSQGRNLNLITMVGGQEYFNNKPIYRVDDVLVTVAEGKTMLAYLVNMKEAIKFFDRKQVTIAKAENFKNGAKMVRVLERIDVKAGTTRSIKKVEL